MAEILADSQYSNQIPEVAQASQLADSYINAGANKLETVATIIGGEEVKKYGLTGENIIKVFAAIGAYNSWQYLSKKGRENWKYVALGVIGIVGVRYMTGNGSGQKESSKL